jgi:hypothetical protein
MKSYYKKNKKFCKELTKDWEKRNPEKARARKDRYRLKKLFERLENASNEL